MSAPQTPDLSHPGMGQPFFEEGVAAGFPTPLMGDTHSMLDLNELCVPRPATTYYVKARGKSMTGAGINDGDILVVDRSLIPSHNDIIIAAIDGEFTVKKLHIQDQLVQLVSAHPDFPPRTLTEVEQSDFFGVVTWIVKPLPSATTPGFIHSDLSQSRSQQLEDKSPAGTTANRHFENGVGIQQSNAEEAIFSQNI